MQRLDELYQEYKKWGIDCSCEEPLARHTSFRIGGPAGLFAAPKNQEALCRAVRLCRQAQAPLLILGKGSNLLFSDAGYNGVVLFTGELEEELTLQGGSCILASAGVPLTKLCRFAAQHNLSGLEFAYGIPGSLGGAVFMNAGAYGGEMAGVLQSVTYLDEAGELVTKPVEELELGYRTSLFNHTNTCILQASLALHPGSEAEITETMNGFLQRRKEKQPLEYPSAGSAFKRPEGAFAGALIEQSGLRGFRVGGAAISEKHCGFIVNLGGATCADVLRLADEVQRIVKEKTGYTLEKEIRVVE